MIDGSLLSAHGKVSPVAFVKLKPAPEIFFCFSWIVAQLARRKELDLASLSHGKAWGLMVVPEDDKIRAHHNGE